MIWSPRRRLRRGETVWAGDAGPTVPSRPLPSIVVADVVVVGAGISGALVTRALRLSGRDIVIVDRRRPVAGSTLASTALLQYELDVPLHRLAQRIGWSRAKRAWQRSARAVADLGDIVKADHLRCQFMSCDSLYLAGSRYGRRALQHEAESRRRAGLSAQYLDGRTVRELYGIERTGAILSAGAAVAHPVRLTAGLLRTSLRAGVRLFHDADIVDVQHARGGVMLVASEGRVLIANHVVFCSGYEVPAIVPKGTHHILSTWAIAARPTPPVPAWLHRTVVWEAATPYLYLRTLPDGRVLAGGRDERSGSAHTDRRRLPRKARLLAEEVGTLLPDLSLHVTHTWGGAFGESTSGLPLIDRLPGHSRAWVVAGFGGNGITFSVVAAQVVSAAINGTPDPDAALFRVGAHIRSHIT